jgi:hypothetical protein|tara:strand:+ start:38 stop:187 length:150 start_codon:yes stop_codon:yes gene_type:complete
MKKVLYIILISIFVLTVFSCSEKDEAETDSATATSKIIVYAVNYSVGGE